MSTALPNPETEKIFEEYRHYMVNEANRLAGYVALFRKLHERRVDRLQEMRIASAFFQVVTDALLSAIVLWVDKMFDEHGERGIFNFLTFIENHRNIFRRTPLSFETISKDRGCIQRLNCLQNFRTLRDKFYAHFDKDYFFDRDRLASEAPL